MIFEYSKDQEDNILSAINKAKKRSIISTVATTLVTILFIWFRSSTEEVLPFLNVVFGIYIAFAITHYAFLIYSSITMSSTLAKLKECYLELCDTYLYCCYIDKNTINSCEIKYSEIRRVVAEWVGYNNLTIYHSAGMCRTSVENSRAIENIINEIISKLANDKEYVFENTDIPSAMKQTKKDFLCTATCNHCGAVITNGSKVCQICGKEVN